ncbi:MAG: hypothetical protein QOH12_2393 [Solirubrobacteraceae bacterium]|nr:hypothetical protein [Solirubrobacteraceae bacterium]
MLCGSAQKTRTRWTVWAGWLVGVAGLAVLAIVVGSVGTVGGGGSRSGGPRFRLARSSGLTVLVPVGWTPRAQAAPAGTQRVVFEDPRQPHFSLSVTATRPARATARARARGLRAQATGRLGYLEHFFGRILFPGGRPAWLSAYESGGFSHVTYVDTACVPGVAMAVEISAPDRSGLGGLAEPIAASSGPQCGPNGG